MMITRALRTLEEQTEIRNGKIVDQLRDDVQKGASLPLPFKSTRGVPAHVLPPRARGRNGGMHEEVLCRICTFGG
jgi:type II secretory pathway component PulF